MTQKSFKIEDEGVVPLTNNGNNMKEYSSLLGKAVDAIVSTFRKRVMHHLLSGRNAILPDKQSQVSETTDFELITWLVTK